MAAENRKIARFLFQAIAACAVLVIVCISYIHSDKAVSFNAVFHELHREQAAKAEATKYWKAKVKKYRKQADGVGIDFANYKEECQEEKRYLTGQLYPQVRKGGW